MQENKKEARQQIQISIYQTDLEILETLQKIMGLSRSAIIRQLVRKEGEEKIAKTREQRHDQH